MIKLIRNLFLPTRFFQVFGGIVALFCIGFAVPLLFPVAKTALLVALALALVEILILFHRGIKITAERSHALLLSLGSDNQVNIYAENQSGIGLNVTLIDELPAQLQMRNFTMKFYFSANEKKGLQYILRPLKRGEYHFGNIHFFIRSRLGLVERRHTVGASGMVAVYPSVLLMKQFELRSLSKISRESGIKRLRRLGHSYEFEQIKNYVRGDDYRSINWKATGRKGELMVNQFEDERSQQIFCVIDNSRSMKLPFGGLSLFDHAINTSLVISNVALQKQDKAGLIVFADKMETFLKPGKGNVQLKRILDKLYRQSEKTLEANYELLYLRMRNQVKARSLVFLFTNFESIYNMERVLSVMRKINKQHLLVTVFFENTEVADFAMHETKNTEDIYHQTMAQKFVAEKAQMVQQLRQYGIQSILTRPEDLTVNAINKYLELKARGMI